MRLVPIMHTSIHLFLCLEKISPTKWSSVSGTVLTCMSNMYFRPAELISQFLLARFSYCVYIEIWNKFGVIQAKGLFFCIYLEFVSKITALEHIKKVINI